VECVDHPEACDRSDDCLTRQVWSEALEAMYEKLESTTLRDLVQRGKACGV
ncbi:MAG: Rrf2 family transcriptional regulator, partial [Syntrophobacteraceae bacterium]